MQLRVIRTAMKKVCKSESLVDWQVGTTGTSVYRLFRFRLTIVGSVLLFVSFLGWLSNKLTVSQRRLSVCGSVHLVISLRAFDNVCLWQQELQEGHWACKNRDATYGNLRN